MFTTSVSWYFGTTGNVHNLNLATAMNFSLANIYFAMQVQVMPYYENDNFSVTKPDTVAVIFVVTITSPQYTLLVLPYTKSHKG